MKFISHVTIVSDIRIVEMKERRKREKFDEDAERIDGEIDRNVSICARAHILEFKKKYCM